MAKGSSDTNMKTVMSWSIGLAGIALLGLIMLILFGNLSGNVGFKNDAQTITVTNESDAFLNITGYILANVNSSNSGYTITEVWGNRTATDDLPYIIPSANYTVSSLGNLTNATIVPNATQYTNVSVSYTYSFGFPSQGLTDTNQFIGNYTTSVLNTGSQFPTVGTIIGVALLLFILISLLIFALTRLAKIGGGTSGGNFG